MRRLLPLLLAFAALLGARPSARADGPIRFPFNPIDGWYIQQGYDQGSHTGYERYALDLARHDDATGRAIVAPVSGTIAWLDGAYGCVAIALGRDALHLSTCHLDLRDGLQRGDAITAGTPVGTIAPAGAKYNEGMPHVHMALFSDPSGGADRSQRVAVPFDGPNSISGIAFPAGQQYTGKELSSFAPGAAPAAPAPLQQLRPGANAIVYFGPALAPSQAFASLGRNWSAVYGWDADAGRWLLSARDAPSTGTLTTLRPYVAYWLVAAAAATYQPPAPAGVDAPADLQLKAGSNLVAYPGADTPAATLATGLNGALVVAYAWDADAQSWRFFAPSAASSSTLTAFRRWGVYWLMMDRAVTLTVP